MKLDIYKTSRYFYLFLLASGQPQKERGGQFHSQDPVSKS